MWYRSLLGAASLMAYAGALNAEPSPSVMAYVNESAQVLVLEHLAVIAGNPALNIDDVENVETVFKDGLGYDPKKLTQSVQGLVGLR